jgi:hypothetical protein
MGEVVAGVVPHRAPVVRSSVEEVVVGSFKALVCRVLGHDAMKVPRDDEGGGYAYECRRCGAAGIRP